MTSAPDLCLKQFLKLANHHRELLLLFNLLFDRKRGKVMREGEPATSPQNDHDEQQTPQIQGTPPQCAGQVLLQIDGESVSLLFIGGSLDEKLPQSTVPTRFFIACNVGGQPITYTPGRVLKRGDGGRMLAHELAREYVSSDCQQTLRNLGTWRRSLINEANRYLEIVGDGDITIIHAELLPRRLSGCWRLCTDYYVLASRLQPSHSILYRPGRVLLPWLPDGKPSGWNTNGIASGFYNLDRALQYTREWVKTQKEDWAAAIERYGRCPNRCSGQS